MKKNVVLAVLLFGLVFFIFGCDSIGYDCEKANISELDSIDYEIISAAFKIFLSIYESGSYPAIDSNQADLYGKSKAELLLIHDSTRIEYMSSNGLNEHRKIDSAEGYLTDRLVFENRKKHSIDNKRIASYKTIQLKSEDEEEFNNLLFSGFKYLYKKYPDAWGIVGFSKPSYDMEAVNAVIYVEFRKHYLWGEGIYMWLKKENGKWYLYDRLRVWIS